MLLRGHYEGLHSEAPFTLVETNEKCKTGSCLGGKWKEMFEMFLGFAIHLVRKNSETDGPD